MENYNESFDNFIDKSLVFFEKPIEKLTNQTVSLFHGTFDDIHNKIMPMGPNVGATKFSKPRWSCYYWDDFESAMKWSIAWAVQRFADVGVMWPMVPKHGTKLMLKNHNGIDDNELRQMIVDKKIITYVYEIKIKANDIEMGSVPSIKEYTVSKPMPIHKKHKILVTRKLLDKYFRTVSVDEWKEAKEYNNIKHVKYKRGPILNRILDNHRDPYRRWIKQDVASGRIKVGDDLSHYKDIINYGVKNDVLGLNKESAEVENYNESLMGAGAKKMAQRCYTYFNQICNGSVYDVDMSCVDKKNDVYEIHMKFNRETAKMYEEKKGFVPLLTVKAITPGWNKLNAYAASIRVSLIATTNVFKDSQDISSMRIIARRMKLSEGYEVNIDRELDILMEGFIDDFKQRRAEKKAKKAEKKAAKKREKIIRRRNELRKEILDGVEYVRDGKELVEETIMQIIRYGEGVGLGDSIGDLVDTIIRAHAVLKLGDLMEPDEIRCAKAVLSLYGQLYPAMHKMAVSGLKRAASREELANLAGLVKDLEDYSPNEIARMKNDILEVRDEIKEIVEEYNAVQQEGESE